MIHYVYLCVVRENVKRNVVSYLLSPDGLEEAAEVKVGARHLSALDGEASLLKGADHVLLRVKVGARRLGLAGEELAHLLEQVVEEVLWLRASVEGVSEGVSEGEREGEQVGGKKRERGSQCELTSELC